ncbi:MAG: hypothetical protein P8P73_07545 [Flavobacteriaceae bacterium]|jgi:hypothetical protein|nr:hypothetical protein [Flavobacteriaceae bacterium]MCP4801479.1 hypothetical protein [Bacteroidota bacterium]MDC0956262.1 hypothetical protein [Flavobacteriaceae bacterium]MDG1379844.1 hypothetical protein [Flavobacteriaceae bacterium]MDG2350930.1 hypothetical protein [Flavobacteriaceae bacterium]
MYSIVKMLHSYWAYLILIMLIVVMINAVIGLTSKKEYLAKDFRMALFGLIISHIQLLLGLVLYFISPFFDMWNTMGGGVMKDATMRLYLVEHPITNILAIILITIGYSKHKKMEASKSKYKTILLFYGLGLVLLLSRIPWNVWPNLA